MSEKWHNGQGHVLTTWLAVQDQDTVYVKGFKTKTVSWSSFKAQLASEKIERQLKQAKSRKRKKVSR